MPLPAALTGLRIPVVAAPMFLASGPDLVAECCRAGVLGTFPALNCRTTDGLGDWLTEIRARVGKAPYGVNLIVHRSNPRLQADLKMVVQHRVPVVITSLGAVAEVVAAVQSYGGLVFHDVINARHAEKAAEAGVDGIIAVCAGAGGHGGTLSPFALIPEIRQVFGGTLLLAGAISTGAQVAAARAMGADLAYLGTRFLATRESLASDAQKAMTAAARAADIAYTPEVSGVAANFLAATVKPGNHGAMNLADEAKAWRDVWSAGQGVAGFDDIPAVADLVGRLATEYGLAMQAAGADPFLR
ncbi:nitronate monooxygenase [Cereibacter sp. SYSU M97828]|nr:nitronate monooxygenase [Cereibacter flavus]